MRRPTGLLLLTAASALPLAGCGSTTTSGNTAPELSYEEAMSEICRGTEVQLAALPEPPEEITVDDFSTEVARILAEEADAARQIDAPSDLADDHRAFIANTDEQAAGWRVVAQAEAGAIGDEMTRIAELTLGRDDLAAAMGIPDCRRET